MPATAKKTEPSRPPTGSTANARPSTGPGTNPQPTTSTTGSAASTPTPTTVKTANKPSDSRFKQQKLKAWQPILTAGTVLPTFFVIGIVFVPVGVVLLITSNNVREYVYEYTECIASEGQQYTGTPCKDIIKNESLLQKSGGICDCTFQITVEKDVEKPVFIYYGLTNFYQNHRRYVKSRDDVQLLGDYKHTIKDCDPFREDNRSQPIVPCGAVANSMFNDTFSISRGISVGENAQSQSQEVKLAYTDIAWPSDKDKKFQNPAGGWIDVKGIAKPPYWNQSITKMEGGFKNESFIVWMRTAALPTFRKLHSRVEHEGAFANGLPAGNYTVKIRYSYPVDSFDGRKRFIISNTSWAGGKNPFLGVAYIVVGSLCILTGFIFLLIHIKFGKSLTELASMN